MHSRMTGVFIKIEFSATKKSRSTQIPTLNSQTIQTLLSAMTINMKDPKIFKKKNSYEMVIFLYNLPWHIQGGKLSKK